ncbi:galactose-proton symporter [Sclerotinia borealis F-4128]|uniref:Galactose-proton symporter n=1 Tax=Sclerotinia borealis (strain F-4128) TaxID=1432307 RepID=W9CMU8_SCLBF|nr:galactose-proton symporter [Sclerotinia borealis F-4128]
MATTMSSVRQEQSGKASPHSARHAEQMTDAEGHAATNRALNDPLASYDEDDLEQIAEDYARIHGLNDSVDVCAFKAGALLAKDPDSRRALVELSMTDINILSQEKMDESSTWRCVWSQTWVFLRAIILCSVCAAVQGVDESVVNGAQIFYSKLFGIDNADSSLDPWLLGITNGAPSATVPVYACETSPASIRGTMAMQWQVFTAFGIMLGLRNIKVQAARDIFQMHMLLEAEKNMGNGSGKIMRLFTFCGINVIAYYSSVIFVDAGFSEIMALVMSLVFGVLNFVGAIPAMFTIDRFGRRWLLLFTFPLMSAFLFLTGWSFSIPEEKGVRIGVVAAVPEQALSPSLIRQRLILSTSVH